MRDCHFCTSPSKQQHHRHHHRHHHHQHQHQQKLWSQFGHQRLDSIRTPKVRCCWRFGLLDYWSGFQTWISVQHDTCIYFAAGQGIDGNMHVEVTCCVDTLRPATGAAMSEVEGAWLSNPETDTHCSPICPVSTAAVFPVRGRGHHCPERTANRPYGRVVYEPWGLFRAVSMQSPSHSLYISPNNTHLITHIHQQKQGLYRHIPVLLWDPWA